MWGKGGALVVLHGTINEATLSSTCRGEGAKFHGETDGEDRRLVGISDLWESRSGVLDLMLNSVRFGVFCFTWKRNSLVVA
ncbi:unnamed protein product [Victoria cruziana]